jgi:hypothetical protein
MTNLASARDHTFGAYAPIPAVCAMTAIRLKS